MGPRGLSHHPSQKEAAGGPGVSPGLRHLLGDADVLKSRKDMGPLDEAGPEGPGGLPGGLYPQAM